MFKFEFLFRSEIDWISVLVFVLSKGRFLMEKDMSKNTLFALPVIFNQEWALSIPHSWNKILWKNWLLDCRSVTAAAIMSMWSNLPLGDEKYLPQGLIHTFSVIRAGRLSRSDFWILSNSFNVSYIGGQFLIQK